MTMNADTKEKIRAYLEGECQGYLYMDSAQSAKYLTDKIEKIIDSESG